MVSTPDDFRLVTAEELPNFVARTDAIMVGAFPKYLNYSPVVKNHWADLYRCFNAYQFALLDPKSEEVASFGNCFPLRWDNPLDQLPEDGLEWALPAAVTQAETGISPNMLCAFQIVVSPTRLNQGMSYVTVRAMIDMARKHGLTSLIAPVRPNRKERCPEVPFDEYVALTRSDGQPVDDWIRVHTRLGGQIQRVCHRSQVVTGSFDDWRKWAGMEFSGSAPFILPRGLVPMEVDPIRQVATYVEPNLWISHEVSRV